MKPVLCIVSVYRPDVMDHAQRAFVGLDNVEVFMDRRVGERRNPDRVSQDESRRKERRRSSIDERLRLNGYAFVPRGD
jgi:hypothetical protein